MHNFWTETDAATFRLELVLFLRNVVLLGCAALVTRVGAGSSSLDAAMDHRALEVDSAA
jgi:hypothetical protein